ncbi:zinc finger protein ZAT9-like [Pyrus x bretschneideri]|uniref:zinc finger protein ZAT9-like n=1 Tax=Pyrus x bretschneideri TaxID=225117 RepID=UPI0005108361|nr:zinc finger protein ZAT9-like [Pyrus x bretschneideri]
MEKQRICKICNKRFSNGKAMGGHMRSHLAKLPLPPKPQSPPQQQHHQLSDSPESSSPPFSTSNRGMHSSLDSAVVHDGGDSDSESHPRNPTHRRSKRRRKVIGKSSLTLPFEAEQVSSVTDAFSTEDVARCLIMLSMDKWDKWEKVKVKNGVDESADEEEEDESDDRGGSGLRSHTRVRTRGKYKCETCDKVFRSYQALGGHRASHKKILKTQVFDDYEEEEDEDFEEDDGQNGNLAVVENHRIFECSVCFKQFDSGQALGGHKKVHYYNNLTINAPTRNMNLPASSTNFVDNLVIDLNLPAPEEEEEEISQVEFSTVFD